MSRTQVAEKTKGALAPIDSDAFKARLLAPSGNRISIKKRKFTTPDGFSSEVLTAVILDFVYVNTYYDKPYDQDSQNTAPACFAVSFMPKELAPHGDSPVVQDQIDASGAVVKNDKGCAGCWANQFGSNQTTHKGKACRNGILLALLPAEGGDGEINYLNLAPTSIKAFNGYMRALAAVGKFPHQVVSTIRIDESSDFAVPPVIFDRPQEIGPELEEAAETALSEARERLAQPLDVSSYTPPAKLNTRVLRKRAA